MEAVAKVTTQNLGTELDDQNFHLCVIHGLARNEYRHLQRIGGSHFPTWRIH